MANKELRRMSRRDLVEVIYEMKKQMNAQEEKIAQLEQQLKDRNICLESSGSIAEAALALNKVFEAAQAAAQDFLSSVKARADAQAPASQPASEPLE